MKALLLSAPLFLSVLAEPVEWEQVYSEGHVSSFVVLENGTLLAASRTPQRILRSENGGLTWSVSSPPGLGTHHLTVLADGAVLSAGIQGVFRSDDDGTSWVQVRPAAPTHPSCNNQGWWTHLMPLQNGGVLASLIADYAPRHTPPRRAACSYHSFAQISPNAEDTWTTLQFESELPLVLASSRDSNGALYAGGLSFLWETGPVSVSTDNGATWSSIDGLSGQMARSLVHTPSGTLLAGLGKLQGGWSYVPIEGSPPSRGLYMLQEDSTWAKLHGPLDALSVAALLLSPMGLLAGTDEGVFVSGDEGASWLAASTGLPEDRSIMALAVTAEGYLLAGLEGQGIFRSAQPVVSTDDDTPSTESLTLASPFPNPASDRVHLDLDLPLAGSVSVVVYDLLGRRVDEPFQGALPAGRHRIVWDASAVAAGQYLVRLVAGGHALSQRVTINR